MAKLILSLCFVLFFSGCLALRLQPQQNECQFNRLNALQPDNRIESEAGVIETWNPNEQQFRCAGVALSRCTLHRNGLRRPFYTPAPQQIFIQQGRGKFGMIFPGCPETFEEPREQEEERPQDRHQKVHNFNENDVIAVPAGVAFWMYNSEDTPVVAVSLIDTSSVHNQLDKVPRRFYLAGKQEQEFLQYQQHKKQRGERGQEEEEGEEQNGNVFKGFSTEFLEQSFQVSREVVRGLKGENEEEEERGGIVRVKGGLSIISPPMRQRPQGKGKGRSRHGNWLEETICTMRLRANIGKTTSPDIYNPRAGSVRTLSSLDFPILSWLGLSAEYGFLHRNAMFVPHYNINANSIIYPVRGRAHVQVVDCSGNTVFDDQLEEFQVLTVPQNFAVAAKALSDNFQYVAFKTNDRPSIATLAGGTSVFKAMPAEVVAQSLGIRTQQAMQLKFNNEFKFLVPPREDEDSQSQSEMRAVA